jgi:hypothetical protein
MLAEVPLQFSQPEFLPTLGQNLSCFFRVLEFKRA